MISVDTWRAPVARAVCEAGADVINDAWGGADPGLVDVAAAYDAAIICTHTGGVVPRTRPHRIEYADVVASAITDTTSYAERALAAGVARESIVIDPAHDFGKTTQDSLDLTRRLDEMVATGWPVLVSLSNKDFVGESLDLPVGERLTGTLAASAIATLHGARIFRVHEVTETRQVVDMVDVILGRRPPARTISPRSRVIETVLVLPSPPALLGVRSAVDPVADLRAACAARRRRCLPPAGRRPRRARQRGQRGPGRHRAAGAPRRRPPAGTRRFEPQLALPYAAAALLETHRARRRCS